MKVIPHRENMPICFIPIAIAAVCFQGSSGVGPDQFSRIVKAAYSDIHDCTFLYEGGVERVASPGITEQYRAKWRCRFQGSYTWRDDGSIFLDCLRESGSIPTPSRDTFSISGDKTFLRSRAPDRRRADSFSVQPRNPWIITASLQSPHAVSWFWYYHWLPDPKTLNYVDLGWEAIHGRRCLKLQVDIGPAPPEANNSKFRFWIDLERGAQPLRIERLIKPPKVASRIDLKLESFPIAGGKRVWLPVSGVKESFLRKDEYVSDPVFRETYDVIRSTIRLNDHVPDSFFSVKKPDLGAGADPLGLKLEFDEEWAKSPPPERTDPKSVEERLAKQLAEADRQSKMIDASSPAREFWSTTLLVQLGLFTVGALLISWFIVVMRRSR